MALGFALTKNVLYLLGVERGGGGELCQLGS